MVSCLSPHQMILKKESIENILEKGESAGNQDFLLFTQMISTLSNSLCCHLSFEGKPEFLCL